MNHEPIYDYLCSLPTCSYFQFLACRFRDLIIDINKHISSDKFEDLQYFHDEILDDIMYLQDILSLKIDKVNYIITNCFFYYTIMPLLCGTLVCKKTPIIMINVSIYVIILLFYYINDERFLNLLFSLLFMEEHTHRLTKYLNELPPFPVGYCYKWDIQKMVTKNINFCTCIIHPY